MMSTKIFFIRFVTIDRFMLPLLGTYHKREMVRRHLFDWALSRIVFYCCISLLFSTFGHTDDSSARYCPISSRFNTTADNLLGYPFDIFYPAEFAHIKANSFALDELNIRNCTSPQLQVNALLACSNKTPCPLNSTLLKVANERSKTWKHSTSFCALQRALQNKTQEVRVFVIGGSVAIGQYSEGCHCYPKLDSKCTFPEDLIEHCSWSYYLARWLSETYPAKVTLHNLAQNGWDTAVSRTNLNLVLGFRNVVNFTENDIIFIDEAANDFANQKEGVLAEFVSLCKHILMRSQQHSWPTIVVLEDYVGDWTKRDNFHQTYGKAASVFGFPLWSYRDVVLDIYANSPEFHDGKFSSVSYKKFLWWNYFDRAFKDHHHGWFIHLYIADMFASLFQDEMDACTAGHGVTPETKPKELMTHDHIPKFGGRSATDMCVDEPPLFQFSSKFPDTYKNINITMGKNWKFFEDRPNKPGWTYENEANASVVANRPQSSILFTLNVPPHFYKHGWMLQVITFKTYLNAGQFSVLVCGVFHFDGDAYWDKKESVPTLKYTLIGGNLLEAWQSKGLCDETKLVVQVITRPLSAKQLLEQQKFRVNEKVKVVGMEICRLPSLNETRLN